MNSSQCFTGLEWKHSVQWYDNFCFLRVCILYTSLFQRTRGICLMKKYPFRIGAVTGVMCVFLDVCNTAYASECMGVCKWQQLLLYSLVILKPHCDEYKYSHTYTFCHSPADNWVCCYLKDIGKAEDLMWTCHKDLTHSNFNWKTFLPQCWELLCALLFFLTPRSVWSGQKKVWWSPLEVLCGYDVTSE